MMMSCEKWLAANCWGPGRSGGGLVGSEALAENHQIALDAVEHGHARQRAPCVKAEAAKKAQARLVVAEHETEHGVDAERRRRRERGRQHLLAEPLTACAFVEVDTDFGGALIRGPAVEIRKAQPRD